MRFSTVVQRTGTNTTGIEVPQPVLDELGAGRRPAVRVTLNGHTYRTTLGSVGGRPMISLSAANREAAGVQGGQEVEVEVDVDTAPREVAVPADLAEALERDPAAKATFDALSFSARKRYVVALEAARRPETRQRRLETTMAELHRG